MMLSSIYNEERAVQVFDKATFSANLKYHLQRSGYSIRQVGDLIQRPASTVQGYLNGITAPDGHQPA